MSTLDARKMRMLERADAIDKIEALNIFGPGSGFHREDVGMQVHVSVYEGQVFVTVDGRNLVRISGIGNLQLMHYWNAPANRKD